MDQGYAAHDRHEGDATPIFGAYRRGYDPDQVDRYVAEQQRRLDDAIHRASESERKLAAAVGQLRELHRRVARLENEERSPQPPGLEGLGERIQRVLQDAWEGAYSLRQDAERDVAELREQTNAELAALRTEVQAEVGALRSFAEREAAERRATAELEAAELERQARLGAEEMVELARREAAVIGDEITRRRAAFLDQVERDRAMAFAQLTHLFDQRQLALAELSRLQATVEATVEEMAHSPLALPGPGVVEATRLGLGDPGSELGPSRSVPFRSEADASGTSDLTDLEPSTDTGFEGAPSDVADAFDSVSETEPITATDPIADRDPVESSAPVVVADEIAPAPGELPPVTAELAVDELQQIDDAPTTKVARQETLPPDEVPVPRRRTTVTATSRRAKAAPRHSARSRKVESDGSTLRRAGRSGAETEADSSLDPLPAPEPPAPANRASSAPAIFDFEAE
jgi:hypothetical protein